MLADEWREMGMLGPKARGGASMSLMIYVEDSDAVFARAIGAGATEERPVETQFYGDRSGTLVDPFGHRWTIATHVEDVPDDEIQRRMARRTSRRDPSPRRGPGSRRVRSAGALRPLGSRPSPDDGQALQLCAPLPGAV
jgi:PhnB protein